MLEVITSITQDHTYSPEKKLELLQQLITIPSLEKLPILELTKILCYLQYYFQYHFKAQCCNKELQKQGEIFFQNVFCHPVIIKKLIEEQMRPHDFESFLLLLGSSNPKTRFKNKEVFELIPFQFLLNESLKQFPKYLFYLEAILPFLTEGEQAEWVSAHQQNINQFLYLGYHQEVSSIFLRLRPKVLNACYNDSWAKTFSLLTNSQFFAILDHNEELLYFDSIQSIIRKRKQKDKNDIETYFSYFYFGQSLSQLKDIYEIISHSTFLSSLSKQELKLASILIQLFETSKNKVTILNQLREIPNYERLLYDLCNHLRLHSANHLTSHVFQVDSYKNQSEIILTDEELIYFFIRSNTDTDPFLSSRKPVLVASFSTISSKNPSNYLGHKRTLFGYCHINPKNIVHIYPHDSLSKATATWPYYYSKFNPYFVDIDTLAHLSKDTYSEILVLKSQFSQEQLKPDYILGINGFREQDLVFAEELRIPKVKLLVKETTLIHTHDFYNSN